MVDTGFSDAERAMQVQGLGPHRSRPDWSLEAQLGRHSLTLAQIPTVLLTHLHYDHADQCAQFSTARFVMQRSELQTAAALMVSRALDFGGSALFYDRRDIAALIDPLWPRVDLLEGNAEVAPGVRCVLYADTRTLGSQAIYVQTTAGTAAILGDIARNIEQGIPPGLFYDLEATRRAMQRLLPEAAFALPSNNPSRSDRTWPASPGCARGRGRRRWRGS